MMLHTPGAVLSTAIALLFANACNFYILKNTLSLNSAIVGFIWKNILIFFHHDDWRRNRILYT